MRGVYTYIELFFASLFRRKTTMARSAEDTEMQDLGGEKFTMVLGDDQESADQTLPIAKPRRRQAWEFKKRQIEFMILGTHN